MHNSLTRSKASISESCFRAMALARLQIDCKCIFFGYFGIEFVLAKFDLKQSFGSASMPLAFALTVRPESCLSCAETRCVQMRWFLALGVLFLSGIAKAVEAACGSRSVSFL